MLLLAMKEAARSLSKWSLYRLYVIFKEILEPVHPGSDQFLNSQQICFMPFSLFHQSSVGFHKEALLQNEMGMKITIMLVLLNANATLPINTPAQSRATMYRSPHVY